MRHSLRSTNRSPSDSHVAESNSGVRCQTPASKKRCLRCLNPDTRFSLILGKYDNEKYKCKMCNCDMGKDHITALLTNLRNGLLVHLSAAFPVLLDSGQSSYSDLLRCVGRRCSEGAVCASRAFS